MEEQAEYKTDNDSKQASGSQSDVERGVIKPKPKHRLCWLCNRQFRGDHFSTRIIDGHERELHKQCANDHDRGIEPDWGMAL